MHELVCWQGWDASHPLHLPIPSHVNGGAPHVVVFDSNCGLYSPLSQRSSTQGSSGGSSSSLILSEIRTPSSQTSSRQSPTVGVMPGVGPVSGTHSHVG